MNLTKATKHLIDNMPTPKIERDFRFHALSILALIVFYAGGAFFQLAVTPNVPVLTLVRFGGGVAIAAT